jgi:hypothetical protein
MVNERLIKQRREEALEIRKKMWWMLPFLLGFVGGCWWFTYELVSEEVLALFALAPSVRVAPLGWLLTPVMALSCMALFVLLLLKAIPHHGIWTKRMVWWTMATLFTAFGLIVTVPLLSPLVQNHYLPKLGYSKCLLLKGGGFSLMSTDWVKNPDWCVKGKTRDWVNEQAALQASKAQTAP